MQKYGWIPLVFIFGLAVGTFAPDLLTAVVTGVFGGIIIQQLWSRFVEEK